MDSKTVTGIATAAAIIVVPIALIHIKINRNRTALDNKFAAKAFLTTPRIKPIIVNN